MRSAYPDLPGPLARALIRDALALTLLVALGWLGLRAYHAVNQLTVVGTYGVEAGRAVRSGFDSVAGAVSGVPLVGGPLAGAFHSAAGGAGGNISAAGTTAYHSAQRLAVIVGLLVWAVPTSIVVLALLPRRLAEIRRLRRLRGAVSGAGALERRRLLALRATLNLPDGVLFAYTEDPAGDLLAGDYEALAAAALEAEGLRAPAPQAGARVRAPRAG